jgi:protein tyrosine/serine phosphatase
MSYVQNVSSNFRVVKFGEISEGVLYRSNNPIYNGHQDKDIVRQMSLAKIQTIVNLSDSMAMLRNKVSCCPYYKKIYDSNNVIALNINNILDIDNERFCRQMQKALLFINEHHGPYLIHCEAGIDRTGFMVMLIEVLMNATFNEIVKDYMLPFVKDSNYSNKDFDRGKDVIINQLTKMKGDWLSRNDNILKIVLEYMMVKLQLNVADIMRIRSIMCGSLCHSSYVPITGQFS